MFAIPFITEPLMFILAFLIGVAITAGVLIVIKPTRAAEDNEDEEDDVDFAIEFSDH